jgi:nicotinate-nucleotide adenylyltransferase
MNENKAKPQRIGIFAGSFDPIHKGHVAIALEAKKQAKLDKIYFLPEIQPRGKVNITHIGHRMAMLKLALKPHEHLHVLELPEKQFAVSKTLPKLQHKFKDESLFLLMGSDVAKSIASWPNAKSLLKNMQLIVAKRANEKLPQLPKSSIIINSPDPAVSSTNIRSDIQKSEPPTGLLKSVQSYIKENWLYPTI